MFFLMCKYVIFWICWDKPILDWTSNPNTWSFDDHKDGCLRAALKLAETLVQDVDVSQP